LENRKNRQILSHHELGVFRNYTTISATTENIFYETWQ